MQLTDLSAVMAIATSLQQAPDWPRSAYETALDPNAIPKRTALVAQDRQTGALSGFAVASLIGSQAELETFAIAIEAQHQGIGTILLSKLIDHMKASGAGELILEVRSSNHRAMALYRRLGWVESGLRVRYYADPEEDAVLMRLELK